MLRRLLDSGLEFEPVFCNTGLEHEATYAFLRELGKRWCPITWLEYEYNGRHSFRVVDYCSASRRGEPFTTLIGAKKMLPNPVARFCTSELKVRAVARYVRSIGVDDYTSYIGLRADEPRRAAKIKGDTKREDVELPLYDDGITLEDVRRFWSGQPFDLELPGDHVAFGNCLGCFLKGRARLELVAQSIPEAFDWWIEQERRFPEASHGNGATFRGDRPTYQQMRMALTIQGRLFEDAIDDDTRPCMCGD